MIPLTFPAEADAPIRYVARVRRAAQHVADLQLVAETPDATLFAGRNGLLAIKGASADTLEGDIILVEPETRRIRRLIRHGSKHNTLVVTERCDQLCQMCSQPPKKTHHDRFAEFTEACLLTEADSVICISGGEPTLYKEQLFALIETVIGQRPDMFFQVLTNAQHFEVDDIDRLRGPAFQRVRWGVPLYAADPELHDQIVGKAGAFRRLRQGLGYLLRAGARIELRTVLLTSNAATLPTLAAMIAIQLPFIARWSVMQLEHTGFARRGWQRLYRDHRHDFTPIARAIDIATLRGIDVALFNFPRCSVPEAYRELAPASISDWKQKFAPGCNPCREREQCAGFFEWHPDDAMEVTPL